jgi:hypothetical protein
MLNKLLPFLFCIILSSNLLSQSYTLPSFEYDSILNLSYGNSLNFQGESEELFFDLYKPKGDNNCKRPIIILIHGGAWVAGSKEDVDLVYMSHFFVKRGYVVANMNYRMGMHKPTNWNLYPLCDPNLFSPCAYIADSSEVYRANYRGMQDTKGLIRLMKSRNEIDSTDFENVFLVGESAGGFIALQTALMNDELLKPINCNTISDAPIPDTDFSFYNCTNTVSNYNRPDLGPVEGSLNLNGFDASVKGVGNFFGGILDISILNANSSTPFLYLFHQGSDIIVHYNFGKLLGRTSYECFAAVNLCQPYYFFPNAYGSKGIRNALDVLGNSNYVAEIIENFEYQNDCFDNGHSIDNINARLTTLNSSFSEIISNSGNNPLSNCESLVQDIHEASEPFPNPVEHTLYLKNSGVEKRIFDVQGKLILKTSDSQINFNQFSSGIYLIKIGSQFFRISKI